MCREALAGSGKDLGSDCGPRGVRASACSVCSQPGREETAGKSLGAGRAQAAAGGRSRHSAVPEPSALPGRARAAAAPSWHLPSSGLGVQQGQSPGLGSRSCCRTGLSPPHPEPGRTRQGAQSVPCQSHLRSVPVTQRRVCSTGLGTSAATWTCPGPTARGRAGPFLKAALVTRTLL